MILVYPPKADDDLAEKMLKSFVVSWVLGFFTILILVL